MAQLAENIETRVSIVKMNEYCQTCWHLPGIVKFISVESTDCNASHKQIQNLEGACVSYLFPTSGHVSILYMCVSNSIFLFVRSWRERERERGRRTKERNLRILPMDGSSIFEEHAWRGF